MFFIWTCNLSDSRQPDTLTFRVNDSLKTSSGKYDSIQVDLYSITGKDTVFQKILFRGEYSNPAQLENLALGEGMPHDFIIRVSGFRNKEKVLEVGVPFADGKPTNNPIVYKAPDPIPLSPNHAPTFVAGLQNVSMMEGETKRIVLEGKDEDGDHIHFNIQNLDSLRGLFANGAAAIATLSAGDSLVILFAPGNAKGNYRFRLAVMDATTGIDVQILTVSVGKINRPPSLSFAASASGSSFLVKEGDTLSLHIVFQDPDSGDKVTLLSIDNPPWPACGQGKYDTVSGIITFVPSFKCVIAGESTFSDLVFRAKDDGSPSEIGQIAARITVKDSNSAPKWKQATVDLQGKEGLEFNLDFGALFLGDDEKDSVVFASTCGSLDKAASKWTFLPGFRDAGTKQCDLTVSDVHVPAASSKMTLKLTIADSLRAVDVAIVLPVNGFVTKDSLVAVKWKVGNQAQAQDTTEKLKAEGPNVIKRVFKDSAGNIGMDSITVFLDTKAPGKPKVGGITPVKTKTPTWTWSSGGNGGNGVYRIKLDSPDLNAAAEIPLLTFTPPTDLDTGSHTLYVQERDTAGNWSSSGQFAIRIDVSASKAPVVTSSQGALTNVPRPIWSWSSGGNGDAGIFRYKLNSQDFKVSDTGGVTSSFTPDTNLIDGTYTLYVQERDSAGNWSESGSFALVVDKIAPGNPVLVVATLAPLNTLRPTWKWKSGGGGVGTYCIKLDDSNMGVGTTLTTDSSFTPGPGSELTQGVHVLYVQERDAAGNWSGTSSTPLLLSLREIVGNRGFSKASSNFFYQAVNKNGVPYILYKESNGQASVMSLFGNTWGLVGNVGIGNFNQIIFGLAIDGQGVPFVCYMAYSSDTSSSPIEAGLLSFRNGVWSKEGPSMGTDIVITQLTLDNRGNPVVAARNSGDLDYSKLFIMRLKDNLWEPIGPHQIANPSASPQYIDLAFNNSGDGFVSFYNAGNDAVSVMKCPNGSNSWDYLGGEHILGLNAYRLKMVLDKEGDPTLAIDYSQSINFAKFKNGAWSTFPGPSNGCAGAFSYGIGNLDNPILAFGDCNGDGGVTVMSLIGGNWIAMGAPNPLPNQIVDVNNISVTVSPLGIPFIGFIDKAADSKVTVTKLSFDP